MSKGFTLDVRGLAGVMKQVETLAQEVKVKASEELNRFGSEVVENAKQLVASNSSDEGNLLRSINLDYAKPNKLSVEINVTADYAAFIEFGTRKYAAQYVATLPTDWKAYAAGFKGKSGGSMDEFIQAIMAWVQRKGIGAQLTKSGNASTSKSSLEQQQQAAYAIALNILQNGVQAKPFLYPSVIKFTPKLSERMKKLLDT